MTTFKRGKTLHSQARQIVYNVATFFEREKSENSLKIPLKNATARTSAATGISESSIKRIKREVESLNNSKKILSTPGKHRKRPSYRNCEIDNLEKCLIRQTVHDLYLNEKCAPSIKKLLFVLQEKMNFEWQMETLRQVLRSLNFRWKKSFRSKKILVEKASIVFQRHNYLNALKKFREEQRCLVYISETWLGGNITFGKCGQNDSVIPSLASAIYDNRLIIVYAGSSDGLIDKAELIYKAGLSSGDYYGQMNGNLFEKWIVEKLLPNLQPHSVICMDNASHHLVKVDHVPSKYSTKEAMLDWLLKKKIPHNSTMRKAELFDIILKHAPQAASFRVDNILIKAGHEIIRIPPHHYDLNPLEYIWSSVTQCIREKNITIDIGLDNLQLLFKEIFLKIVQDEWNKHFEHVKKVEDFYWNNDGLIEDIVDKKAIKFAENDSDSSSSIEFLSDMDIDVQDESKSLELRSLELAETSFSVKIERDKPL